MIKKPTYLYYILKTDKSVIKEIFSHLEDFYTPKQILKSNGKIRTCYNVKEPLRGIQKRIHQYILNKIEIPEFVIGCKKGKGKDGVFNANSHKGKKYKFCTDIKDFFPSINHHLVYQMFLSYNFSPDVSSILTKLTTYQGALPQGTSTSSYIASLVFLPVDQNIVSLSEREGITYSRYVDDLTFSSSHDFKQFTKEIIEIVLSHKFNISHKKTKYKAGKLGITGPIAGNNKLYVQESVIEKFLISPIGSNQQSGLKLYMDRIQNFNL